MSGSLKLILVALAGAFLVYADFAGYLGHGQQTGSPSRSRTQAAPLLANARWGNPASLPDHFARHGADVGARDASEYALLASQLLQRAKTEGLPAKVDERGEVRVFDPQTGAFGAYNADGTTKTFFKPGNPDYFVRQPGRAVDLRHWPVQ